MTELSHQSPALRTHPMIVPGLVAAWFAVILLLTLRGAFETEAPVPLALITATATPPLLFWVAWRISDAVKAWVSSLDLALVTGIQAWRVIGAAFLFLWAMGELPWVFSAPAGFGDVAVGLFAVAVTVMVARRSAGWRAASWSLITAGLLDFVAAFATAVLSGPGLLLSFGGLSAGPVMQSYPMALIPAFGVPLFIIAHMIAWIKLTTED